MIGEYQIALGADQFISGMSSSDFATDGALGTSTSGINPFVSQGIIRAIATSSDLSSNILGNIIASAEDSQSVSAYVRTMVDDGGNYYTYSGGGSVTKTNTATTNVAHYTAGKTDMVAFGFNTYISVDGDIDLWNTSGSPTLTNSWWVGTKGQSAFNPAVPHPMLVYQGFLWIADANKLHYIDINQNITLAQLTLNTNEFIYALGIDPGTGLMMISVQTTTNLADTLTSREFVYLYDGISSKPTRKIEVDDLVTAFYHLEGTVFIGAGQILGQWNGNGVTFLRKFQNVTLSGTDLAYKHHFTNTHNILHVVDGQSVLSYGPVVAGKKGFFYTATNPSGVGHLSCVIPLGSNKIGIGYATNKLASFDMFSTSAGTGTLYFNNIFFPRPIYVRRMRMITTGITTTAGIGGFAIIDEKNNVKQPAIVNFVVAAAVSPQYVFDADFTSFKVQAIQPRILMDTQAFGIIRVIVYYDIAE